jgi:hypothetical protein
MEQIFFASDEIVHSLLHQHQLTISQNSLHNRYLLTHLFYLQGKLCLEERKIVENPQFSQLYLADDFQMYNELKKRNIFIPLFNHITLIKSLILNRRIIPTNIRPEILSYFFYIDS